MMNGACEDVLHTTLFGIAKCWLRSVCLSCVVMFFQQVSDSWRAFLLLSLFLQLASWLLVIYWSRCHWNNHPISRAIQAHIQPPHSCWGSVATSINTEFRRIDKFATGAPGARVIVTDSWVLKVSKKPFIRDGQINHVGLILQYSSHSFGIDSFKTISIIKLYIKRGWLHHFIKHFQDINCAKSALTYFAGLVSRDCDNLWNIKLNMLPHSRTLEHQTCAVREMAERKHSMVKCFSFVHKTKDMDVTTILLILNVHQSFSASHWISSVSRSSIYINKVSSLFHLYCTLKAVESTSQRQT